MGKKSLRTNWPATFKLLAKKNVCYILWVYYMNDIICSVCVGANTCRALCWGREQG